MHVSLCITCIRICMYTHIYIHIQDDDAAGGKKKARNWDPLAAAGGDPNAVLDRSTDRPADGSMYVDENETKVCALYCVCQMMSAL